MTATEIIDYIRANPDHPPTISPAEWASVVNLFDRMKAQHQSAIEVQNELAASRARQRDYIDSQQAEIQRLQTVIAQLLDAKKNLAGLAGIPTGPQFRTLAELEAESKPPSRPIGEWLAQWVESRRRRGLSVEVSE